MSATPLDKPPDGDGPPDDRLSQPSSRLRAGFERVVSLVRTRLRSITEGLKRVETAPHGGPSAARYANCPPANTSDGESVVVDGYPDREYPLTHPGRDVRGINTPDVVSVETDAGLRLTVPENPDAEMTSDVWTTVDP